MSTVTHRAGMGPTPWRLVTLTALPKQDLLPLVRASRVENYTFVDRLVDDYHSGHNRFDQPGEVLLAVYDGSTMVAIGGLNRDPYLPGTATGRVRHLYVMPAYRRQGVGRFLMCAIIASARSHFERLTLRTFSPSAAAFYRSLGFTATRDIDQASHVLLLASA